MIRVPHKNGGRLKKWPAKNDLSVVVHMVHGHSYCPDSFCLSVCGRANIAWLDGVLNVLKVV